MLEVMEHISPANHAEKIGKPLAIAHGENDTRVPLGEALRMWQEVKKQGVQCEVIVCEGEGHGKRLRSKSKWKPELIISLHCHDRISAEECHRVYECRNGALLPTIPPPY